MVKLNELVSSVLDKDLIIKNAVAKAEELVNSGHFPEAEILVNQLLIVDPENIVGLQLKGLFEYQKRNYKESIEYTSKIIKLEPDNPENYNNIALAYLHSGEKNTALKMCLKALSLNENHFDYNSNLGLIYRTMNDNENALKFYKKALSIKSDPIVLQSIGSVYGEQKKYQEAIDYFLESIEKNPNFLDARINLAYAYHLTGQWEKAWEQYESRIEYWKQQNVGPGMFLNLYDKNKSWNGKDDLNNKTIVVYCEQGHGDIIQFLRFIPELKEKAGKVVLEVPSSLFEIAKQFTDYVDDHLKTKDYDYHCSILSLPYFLNLKTPDKFKSNTQYIKCTNSIDMSTYKNTLNVGICWAGNPGHPNDALRSCHLSNFREISKIEGVKLFSLQKEISKRAYVNMPNIEIDFTNDCEDISLVDTSELMNNFQETANLINSLDLVITVDTSVLHISGAIGKKTFAIIANNPDWRWTSSGKENVWYDSVQLFRQNHFNDWKNVFEEIYEEVRKLANEKSLLSNK